MSLQESAMFHISDNLRSLKKNPDKLRFQKMVIRLAMIMMTMNTNRVESFLERSSVHPTSGDSSSNHSHYLIMIGTALIICILIMIDVDDYDLIAGDFNNQLQI